LSTTEPTHRGQPSEGGDRTRRLGAVEARRDAAVLCLMTLMGLSFESAALRHLRELVVRRAFAFVVGDFSRREPIAPNSSVPPLLLAQLYAGAASATPDDRDDLDALRGGRRRMYNQDASAMLDTGLVLLGMIPLGCRSARFHRVMPA